MAKGEKERKRGKRESFHKETIYIGMKKRLTLLLLSD